MNLIKEIRQVIAKPISIQTTLLDGTIEAYNYRQKWRFRKIPTALNAQLKENAAWRNKFKGQRCFILGNGPSLKELDLSRLKSEHTFVVNKFAYHPDAKSLDPTFYLAIDWKLGAGIWGNEFLEKLEASAPNATCFMTPENASYCNDNGLLQSLDRSIVMPSLRFTNDDSAIDDVCDMTRCFASGDNVTKAAIGIALYMGFKEIYLIGIDGNGLLLTQNSHFYGQVDEHDTQEEFEQSLLSMFLGLREFRTIKSLCDKQGVKLRHVNPSTIITAIEQETFENLGI